MPPLSSWILVETAFQWLPSLVQPQHNQLYAEHK